ncbi:ABC transporter permease [Rhizobium puerariae]|uniref:ABC transporter permease n=1 Tax=Rhizobium puerariae TaxID=1585791 RepID=A0ABV6AJC1_9HYPH
MTAFGDFLNLALSSLTPILIAALFSRYAERSGATNIAIDGTMLLSAFAALAVAYGTGNAWLGLVAAISAGMLCAAFLALFALGLQCNLIIAGIAFNMLATGLSYLLLRSIFDAAGNFSPIDVSLLPRVDIGTLSSVLVIGGMLKNQSILVYLVLALVVGQMVLLDRSAFAVRVRAVGDTEDAAAAVGIRVWLVRTVALVVSGAGAGVAGAYLSLSSVGSFNPFLTGGLGFIAFSAVIFGRATSPGIILAAVLFATFSALVIVLQGTGVLNQQLLQALPYATTIAALALHGAINRRRDRFETTDTSSMPVIVPRG